MAGHGASAPAHWITQIAGTVPTAIASRQTVPTSSGPVSQPLAHSGAQAERSESSSATTHGDGGQRYSDFGPWTGPSQQSPYGPSYGGSPELEPEEASELDVSSELSLAVSPDVVEDSLKLDASSSPCVVELAELCDPVTDVTVGSESVVVDEEPSASPSSSAAASLGGPSAKQPASARAHGHRRWWCIGVVSGGSNEERKRQAAPASQAHRTVKSTSAITPRKMPSSTARSRRKRTEPKTYDQRSPLLLGSMSLSGLTLTCR